MTPTHSPHALHRMKPDLHTPLDTILFPHLITDHLFALFSGGGESVEERQGVVAARGRRAGLRRPVEEIRQGEKDLRWDRRVGCVSRQHEKVVFG